MCLPTSGILVISPKAWSRRPTVSAATWEGAAMPSQMSTWNPGTALSAMVGTCGRIGSRPSVAISIAFTFFCCTHGSTATGGGPRRGIEHQRRNVMRRADARRAGRELAGIRLAVGDELFGVTDRKRWMRKQHQWSRRHECDRRKISEDVESDVLVQPFRQYRGRLHDKE